MDMSGKFEGIGARLQKRKDQTKIVEIISGGPVWRDQNIEVGDEIIKVGQSGEDPVDIVGMRLGDAIKLIKGPKGSLVDLTVKKVDGSIQVISSPTSMLWSLQTGPPEIISTILVWSLRF